MAVGTTTLTNVQGTYTEAERYVAEDLTFTTEALKTTLADLQTEIAAIGGSTVEMLTPFSTAGATATTRRTEAEATLASVDAVLTRLREMISTIEGAAARFDMLIDTQGAPLLAEARSALAEVSEVISVVGTAATTDLPMIVADIRDAAETASAVIADVGMDLSDTSGRIEALSLSADTALTKVTTTFSNANLDRLTRQIQRDPARLFLDRQSPEIQQ